MFRDKKIEELKEIFEKFKKLSDLLEERKIIFSPLDISTAKNRVGDPQLSLIGYFNATCEDEILNTLKLAGFYDYVVYGPVYNDRHKDGFEYRRYEYRYDISNVENLDKLTQAYKQIEVSLTSSKELKLISNLEMTLSDKSELTQYKLTLLHTISEYINDAEDLDNNKDRQNDIAQFVEIIKFSTNKSDLNKAFKDYFQKMETGIEKGNLGKIFSLVSKANPSVKTSLIGSKIYRSELRDRLKEIIDKDELQNRAKAPSSGNTPTS